MNKGSRQTRYFPRLNPIALIPSRMGLGLLVAALAVVMGGLWPHAVAADAPVSPATSEVDTAFAMHEIAVRDHSFDPETVTITVGSIVRWTNVGETLHTTTSDDGHWNWTLVPGASYSVRFLSAGTYDYHCILHPAWSPDGRTIVFNAEFEERRWALFLVPSRGGAVNGPVSVGVEPDWASGSLIPLPTPVPGATDTPPIPLTPLPFPTPLPTMPGPTPSPTMPGPTDPPPPPPTFPIPIEPTPEPHTPTSVVPTIPPIEPTNPTPDPTRGNKIYLSITYKNG